MSGPRWPLVVDHLLDLLPDLPGWDQTNVFDTNTVTTTGPSSYAVVVRPGDTSGSYTRSIAPSGLVAETGTVRLLVGTRTGSTDPAQAREDGFALATALEDALLGDHTLAGVLGEAGTVSLTVDVQAVVGSGSTQTLLVSVVYTSLT